MASMKIDNFLKPFAGRPGQSWEQFWEKFLVLADIQAWDDDAKMMKNFPLFLDGDAFLVYSRMSSGDRKKKDEVTKLMVQSFSMTKSSAYDAFVGRKYRMDESVDAYVADLQRLASLCGHAVTGDDDAMVVAQLVSGLPSTFARELRLAMAGKDLKISACLDVIRALRSASTDIENQRVTSVTAAAAGGTAVDSALRKSVLCFRCGEVGHMRRNCPSANRTGKQQPSYGRANSGRKMTCFFCDQEGHLKSDCPDRKAWMARKQGQAAGVNVSASSDADHCLCTVNVTAQGALPRIYVDVRPESFLDSPQAAGGRQWSAGQECEVAIRGDRSSASGAGAAGCRCRSSRPRRIWPWKLGDHVPNDPQLLLFPGHCYRLFEVATRGDRSSASGAGAAGCRCRSSRPRRIWPWKLGDHVPNDPQSLLFPGHCYRVF